MTEGTDEKTGISEAAAVETVLSESQVPRRARERPPPLEETLRKQRGLQIMNQEFWKSRQTASTSWGGVGDTIKMASIFGALRSKFNRIWGFVYGGHEQRKENTR